MLQEQINPVSIHAHPLLNFLNNIGSSTPNGINIIMFSTNIACIWKVCPHVSNKTKLIAFLLPGSLHKKAMRKITRMYAKKKANGILCFIVLFFPHNQLTANTMHPLKKMAGIKYDTGCLKSWIIDLMYHLITNHLFLLVYLFLPTIHGAVRITTSYAALRIWATYGTYAPSISHFTCFLHLERTYLNALIATHTLLWDF